MKQLITSFFLLFISLGAFCQSEAIMINESFENQQMAEVFELLKEKYQLKLAYDYESIENITVNKKINEEDLASALDLLFSNTPLEYQIVDNNRVLIRKVKNLTSSNPIQKFLLKGKITDGDGKTPLAYATIFCPATNQGCSTDENGDFSFSISSTESEGTFSIQYLGYIPRIMTWKKGMDLTHLDINLQAKILDFKEVTILEKIPTISLSQEDGSMIMRAGQLNTLPSFVGGNDVFRAIQLLPGIAANDDLSSEIKIRGSQGDENMVILDGITLYKVDHYFGIFSAINPNIVNQVKVYKNAFPVEYGGRTAGVVDLSTNQTAKSTISGGLQVDLLTSNAYLAVPISDKMGFFIGGRTTNKNVANEDLFELLLKNKETPNGQNNTVGNTPIINEEPSFKFYDLNAKWLWNIQPKTTVAANFFKGYDKFTYEYQRILPTQDQDKKNVTNTAYWSEYGKWNNQGASLQLNHQWTSKITSDINLAYSSFKDEQAINSFLVEEKTPRSDPNKPPKPVRIDTTGYLTNYAANDIQGLELNLKNEWTIDDQQQLTFGYHLVDNKVDVMVDVDNKQNLDIQEEGVQHSAYLQYNLKTKKKLNAGLGLRNTYYNITNKNYLSPRINLSYKVSDNFQLKTAWSKYNQFLRKNYREDRYGRSYEFWVLGSDAPDKFPISSSEQWMTGFNFSKNGFELDVEAYYKTMNNITEYALEETGFQNIDDRPSTSGEAAVSKLYIGTGISKGIDVLLKKSAGKYTGWLAYTLSKVTHSFPEIKEGAIFPSQDDQRHQLKWINQYRYKKFDFSATYVFSTGRPYTDVSLLIDPKDRKDLTPEERIAYLPNYKRIDVAASYRFDWGSTKAKVGLSIFNVLDTKNVKYRQYIYSIPNSLDSPIQNKRKEITGTQLNMLGFTPNLSFSLDF